MTSSQASSARKRGAGRSLWLVALLAAAILLPRAYFVNRAHSETCDEDVLLLQGTQFWHRDPGLVHQTLNDPHLGQALGALPLVLMGANPYGDAGATVLFGQTYTPEMGLRAVALWKATLFIPFVMLGFWWIRRLYGVPAGWFAAGLLLVEPTIAGHVHLGALDVIGTSGIIAACIAGWRYFEKPASSWRLLGAGLGCAAALMLKHTGVAVPPVLICFAGVWWLKRRRDLKTLTAIDLSNREASLAAHLLYLCKGVLVTLLLMWALTGFDGSPPNKGMALPGGIYLHSVYEAFLHVSAGNFAVLHGEYKQGHWWYYYFAVALYKIPISVFVALAIGALSLIWRRPRWGELSLFIPLAIYTVFMSLQSVNLGWRHFLPAYTLAMLLAARFLAPRDSIATLAASKPAASRFLPASLAALIVASTALDALRFHPDYLAYINWPRSDIHVQISDSNIDWGQGLKQARRWIDERLDYIRGRTVYLRPFGVSRRGVKHYVGDAAVHLPFGQAVPREGVLIISPVILSGLQESGHPYAFLNPIPPDHVIGHALYVYDVDRLREQGLLPLVLPKADAAEAPRQ